MKSYSGPTSMCTRGMGDTTGQNPGSYRPVNSISVLGTTDPLLDTFWSTDQKDGHCFRLSGIQGKEQKLIYKLPVTLQDPTAVYSIEIKEIDSGNLQLISLPSSQDTQQIQLDTEGKTATSVELSGSVSAIGILASSDFKGQVKIVELYVTPSTGK